MSELAAGLQADSPSATPTRAAISCAKFRASPDTAVIALQTTIPSEISERREPRSAQRAMGTPASEYTSAKANPDSNPSSPSDNRRSCLIGCKRITST